MSSIMNPASHNRLRNMLQLLAYKVEQAKQLHDFNYRYETKNNTSCIVPFLDSIGSRYQIISSDLVLICCDPHLEQDLVDLGFVSSCSVMPTTKQYADILASTDRLFIDRMYQTNYNFELILVEPHHWEQIKTTSQIVTTLKFKPDEIASKFLTILREISCSNR